MSFNFVEKVMCIGGRNNETPTLQFYKKGFVLHDNGGETPSWQDIILSGNTALTLVNAKANGLNYVKLFGACEQNGTPTPDSPVDIVCNNGAIKYSANMANVNAQTALIGYYTSAQGVVTADIYNWMYQDFIPVKPNTTYTLTMSTPVYYVSISEYSTTSDSGFVIRKTGSAGSNTKLTITTGSTTNYIRFGTNINRTKVTLDAVLAIDWMLNVGNSMAYQPYVEGGIYADGTVETVDVHGKNLADSSFMDNSSYENLTIYGVSTDYAKILPVQNGQTYTLSATIAASGSYYYYMKKITPDGNSQIIQMWFGSTDANKQYTFTASDNATYLVFFAASTSVNRMILTNYQLELGNTATEYEPYFNGGTATVEMLLSVGDYKDQQEVLTGAVTRNVGIKVLDGSESWLRGASSFYIDDIITDSFTSNTFNIYCSHYLGAPGDAQASELVNANRIRLVYSESYRRLNVFAIMNDYPTVEDFQQFLADQYAAGTPVIVVYPLAEPTTETVAGQHLTTQAGTNIVEITQASIDNLALEVSYKGKQ